MNDIIYARNTTGISSNVSLLIFLSLAELYFTHIGSISYSIGNSRTENININCIVWLTNKLTIIINAINTFNLSLKIEISYFL